MPASASARNAPGDRLAATPPLAWTRRRFPRQVAWARRRLAAGDPLGFWLTFTIAAGALAAWAFGAVTQDVVAHDETALRDPHVAAWVAAHRTGWLTAIMKAVTWLGSDAVTSRCWCSPPSCWSPRAVTGVRRSGWHLPSAGRTQQHR